MHKINGDNVSFYFNMNTTKSHQDLRGRQIVTAIAKYTLKYALRINISSIFQAVVYKMKEARHIRIL